VLPEVLEELQSTLGELEVAEQQLRQQNEDLLAARVPAEAALRQRNRELALLNRVGQELTVTLDFQQVTEKLLPVVTEIIGSEGASVWLWDEKQEDWLVCHAFARGQELEVVNLRLRPEQGIAGWVMQTGERAIVPNVRDDPRFYPGIDELTGFYTISLLAVPLWVRGKVIGVLEVVNKRSDVPRGPITDFDEDDVTFAETMAASAAIAIDNARLVETLQQRNSELALLNQAGQALSATLDLDEVLATVLEEVSRLLGAVASSVWLTDPETDEVVCRQATGPHSEMVRGWRLAPGEGLAGWVARNGESLIVPDTRVDERHYKGVDRQTGLEMRSALSVPLRVTQELMGALHIVDTEVDRFKPTDLALVEPLAATAAIAIENARLYEQTRRDAETRSVLLREINHRVKNNLSTIIGLLYAERRHAELQGQSVYRAIMTDLVNRVQGLATVHSLLSASEWKPVRLSELATQVIDSALQALPRDKQISVEVSPSPVRVSPDQANNLALVVNELASNTAKYTLLDRDRARVVVNVALQDGTVQLEFRDDGPGYPDKVVRLEAHNVGLYLVQTLVRDGLRGELSLHNDNGAVTTIRFSGAE
jgi:GAF domain-containing protein